MSDHCRHQTPPMRSAIHIMYIISDKSHLVYDDQHVGELGGLGGVGGVLAVVLGLHGALVVHGLLVLTTSN